MATAGVALFSCMNLTVKLVDRIPSIELTFFRCLFGWIAVWPLLIPLGRRALHTGRPVAHALRGGLGAVSLILTMYALTHLPMAEAVTYLFARGLYMVPLAILMLGEAFRVSRVVATLAGFAGVMAMMRPDLGFQAAAVAALVSSLLSAFVAVVIRKMMTLEPAATVMFYFGLCTTAGAGLLTPFVWLAPTLEEYALMALMGILGGLAQILQFMALREAEASIIVPFDYLLLPFAAFLGFVFLGEVPTATALFGAAVTIGANLFLAWRTAR
jgi:drug/metabolite transporter (DMT)-like permease